MPTACSRRFFSVLACCFVLAAVPALAAEQRGVTDSEIVIGTITDLSGVTAIQGVNNSNAIRMAFDEINAKGGVNGREIKYIVEDNQYTVPRAVQAMNKLLNSDNVSSPGRRRHADERREHAGAVCQGRAEHVSADLRAVDVPALQQAEVRAVRVVL